MGEAGKTGWKWLLIVMSAFPRQHGEDWEVGGGASWRDGQGYIDYCLQFLLVLDRALVKPGCDASDGMPSTMYLWQLVRVTGDISLP